MGPGGIAGDVRPPADWSVAEARSQSAASDGTGGCALHTAGEGARVPAERALEILMEGETENIDAELRNATSSLREAATRRIETQAKIRAILQRIEEAQANRSWWQKLCDGLGVLGTVLGALGAVATVVATAGVGGIAVAAVALSLAGAAAGLGSSMTTLGVGAWQKEADNLKADRMAQDIERQSALERLGREQAVAEALVAVEDGMRQRALAWIDREDEGRRRAAAPDGLR